LVSLKINAISNSFEITFLCNSNPENPFVQFTAIIEKSKDGWFVGQIEEYPAAISQGKTLKEVKVNLSDALKLLFEVNRGKTSDLPSL